jgi:hypothetical protein
MHTFEEYLRAMAGAACYARPRAWQKVSSGVLTLVTAHGIGMPALRRAHLEIENIVRLRHTRRHARHFAMPRRWTN